MKNTRTRKLGAVLGSVAALLVMALAAGFVSVPDPASAAQYVDSFQSRLAPADAAQKIQAGSDSPTGLEVAAHARSATVIQTVVAPRTSGTRARTTSASTDSSTTQAVSTASAPAPSQATAQSILNRYIARYPILQGATVSYGDAKGYQAICYYKSGRIVISTTHTRSLETIIGHEIWHIIDWRDNGVIDWGENVPPN
jgi:hypothetical protein